MKIVAKPTLVDRLMAASGSEIREARERIGMTQAELASRAGTNQQTIDRIERGLTKQSKFVPEIRQALGLPFLPDDITESMLKFSGAYGDRIGTRARIADPFDQDAEKMPVFALEPGDGALVVSVEPRTYLPRSYPVEGALHSYGIIVPDDSMEPVLRPNEIAVIDPDAAPDWGTEVFLVRALPDGKTAGLLRTWIGFEDIDANTGMKTRLRTWNPSHIETVNSLLWPAMGAVVAKLPGKK